MTRLTWVDLASALIRIPSFKTEETPGARFLERFFREREYRVELQEIEPGRFQTIATRPGTGGGASLMLNGHTDINALTRRWRRDPWTPVLEGDRLYVHWPACAITSEFQQILPKVTSPLKWVRTASSHICSVTAGS